MMVANLLSMNGLPDIALDEALTLVGRHPGCDVQVPSPLVSMRHCCLTVDGEGDGLLVRDLASKNGTRINGDPVESGRLRPGDILSIGHHSYRLALGEPSESSEDRKSVEGRASAISMVRPAAV